MEIKQRGTAPYKVWSGPHFLPDGTRSPQQFPPNEGHGAPADSFLDALREIFSLSEAGDKRGPYIRDAEGNIIFTTESESDRQVLRSIDQLAQGFLGLSITETST